jgi:DME family drug/metabolite transporter
MQAGHAGHAAAWSTVLGVGLGLAAGTTYAIYSWAAHRLIGRGVTTRAAMGSVFGLGALLLLPVLLATGAPLAASWANAAVGAYLALVPMFTGYLLFGWALASVSASTATTLSLLEPAVAAILAVTVVGERLPVAGWAGLTLIAGCLIVLTVGGRAVLRFLYFATAGRYRRLFDGRHIITCLSRYGREVGSARL